MAGWTNTEIRKANRLLLRQGSWSNKQEKALLKNLSNDAEAISGLAAEYGIRETDVPNFIKNNQGHVYAFLKSYSADWNEYFNS
jgi:LAS superfamily LD-carboxypeptidase LdcB